MLIYLSPKLSLNVDKNCDSWVAKDCGGNYSYINTNYSQLTFIVLSNWIRCHSTSLFFSFIWECLFFLSPPPQYLQRSNNTIRAPHLLISKMSISEQRAALLQAEMVSRPFHAWALSHRDSPSTQGLLGLHAHLHQAYRGEQKPYIAWGKIAVGTSGNGTCQVCSFPMPNWYLLPEKFGQLRFWV